jgi:hypothetical protein
MKAIDIFANIANQMRDDSHVQKYGAILLTSGGKGIANANPAVVWAEATVAVIEAAGAYFRYCTIAEGTEQLRQLNQTLEMMLAKDLQLHKLELKAMCRDREGRQARIERTITAHWEQNQLTQKKIRNQLNMLRKMHGLLQEQRLQSGAFRELLALQVCLDSCVDATLSLLLNFHGD